MMLFSNSFTQVTLSDIITIAVGVLVALFLFRHNIGSYYKQGYDEAKAENVDLRNQIGEMKTHIAKLEEQIRHLQSRPNVDALAQAVEALGKNMVDLAALMRAHDERMTVAADAHTTMLLETRRQLHGEAEEMVKTLRAARADMRKAVGLAKPPSRKEAA